MERRLTKVSHARARIAIQRLINSHFHNDNRAKCSIPADPENDDDLVAMRYTLEVEAELAAARAVIDKVIAAADRNEWADSECARAVRAAAGVEVVPTIKHWERHPFVADMADPGRCHQWVWFVGKPVLCGCRENEPVHRAARP